MCSSELIAGLHPLPETVAAPSGPTIETDPEPRARHGRRAFLRSLAGLSATAAAARGAAGTAHAAAAPGRAAPAAGRVVDLTHELSRDFPVWLKFSQPPVTRPVATLAADGYNDNVNTVNEHTGTHIDAPLHFDDSGASVAQLPATTLVAPLAVIRIARRAAADNTTELTVDDILGWERRHGRLPHGAFVAMDSGWSARVSVPGAFLNYDPADGTYRWPGLAPEAARFLVTERNVVGAGVDTTSLDMGTRAMPLVHQTLLPAGRYGLECIASLDLVPESGATLVVGAPKLRGGTGGPARVLALV